MSAVPNHRRNESEGSPRDRFDAATIHACNVYTLLVRRLTKRAVLGKEGEDRAKLIATHRSAPRPSDWERLAAAGQRAGVVAYFKAETERLAGVMLAPQQQTPDIGTYAIESGQYLAADIAAERDPDQFGQMIDEGLDVMSILEARVKYAMQQKGERTFAKAAAQAYFGRKGA